jgi:hypothetical protein
MFKKQNKAWRGNRQQQQDKIKESDRNNEAKT